MSKSALSSTPSIRVNGHDVSVFRARQEAKITGLVEVRLASPVKRPPTNDELSDAIDAFVVCATPAHDNNTFRCMNDPAKYVAIRRGDGRLVLGEVVRQLNGSARIVVSINGEIDSLPAEVVFPLSRPSDWDRLNALSSLVRTINATGGITAKADGCAADPDWCDLADAYCEACAALGMKPEYAEEGNAE